MHPLQPKEHTVKKREWKITARATDTFGLQMCSDEVCSILDRGRNQKVTFPLLFSTLAVNATLWLKTQKSTEGLRLKPQHTQPMHCSSHVGFLLFFKWFFENIDTIFTDAGKLALLSLFYYFVSLKISIIKSNKHIGAILEHIMDIKDKSSYFKSIIEMIMFLCS